MIKNIGFRTNWFGNVVLTVTEDFDYGDDWNGMPNSLVSYRTRDAIPSDFIEIINNKVEWK